MTIAIDTAAPADRTDTIGTLDMVAPGVTDEQLARVMALAGFAPAATVPARSTLAADDHPVVVAARIASAATTLRAIALMVLIMVVGAVATMLV